jgi:hypothetical protein
VNHICNLEGSSNSAVAMFAIAMFAISMFAIAGQTNLQAINLIKRYGVQTSFPTKLRNLQ